jgi:hypothetical protein
MLLCVPSWFSSPHLGQRRMKPMRAHRGSEVAIRPFLESANDSYSYSIRYLCSDRDSLLGHRVGLFKVS